jgi:hypothetical protein
LWVVLALAALTLALVPSAMPAADTGTASSAEAGPVDVALSYVDANAAELGVTRADVADLFVTSSYRSSHNGVTHVNLNQRYQGREVFGGHATVNVAADGKVIFAAGSFVNGLRAAASADTDTDAIEAVEAAADALDLAEPSGLRILRRSAGAAQETVVSDGGISDKPIPARLGWQPTADGLRLAWQLTIDDSSDVHLWNATVDAETGELLDADDWTSDDSLAGLQSALARPGETPATTLAAGAAALSSPNPVIDGSSYRVFALPKESPNDGPRTLETNPADATASPFGWHDTDGAAGPEFTTARGNNAHAYTDHNNDNAPTGGLPAVVVDAPSSAAGEYDAAAASFGPRPTEAGVAGSIVLADDGVGVSSDGCQPFALPAGAIALIDRGECTFVIKVNNAQAAGASAVVVANNVAGAPFAMGGSDPGIVIPSVMISLDDGNTIKAGLPATGSVKIVPEENPTEPEGGPGLTFDFPLDLTQHPHDYWDAAVTNLFFWNNTIHDVLYGYGFDEPSGNFQVNNYGRGGVGGDDVQAEAQDGGGTNNANFSTPAMDGGRPRMQMYLWTLGEPTRDGDLENGIIIHEYGHGVSNRLTGGPNINCLTGNEQAGEGWSDYLAISMLLDPALDDPQGARGMGPYALFQDSRQGNGIRPRPYSRNMEIQPFTYDSIKTGAWLNGTSLALPHGLGHGWAAVLWDMTWDLIDKHGFNPNVYGAWNTGGNNRAIQYVIDGLKMQGCGPGLVVARAAIIAAADTLTAGEDTCTVWATFARRGLGFSAVQGTTNRNDNDEAFDTRPDCRRGFQSPVTQPYGSLNEVDADDAVPLRFTADGYTGLDVLANSGSPFSRKVDCDTLRVVSSGEFITPRELPIATQRPGNSKLTINANGVYNYPWKTLGEWAGTCRELVLTRDDGKQHRAFFRFL